MGGMFDDERLVDREALEGFEVFPTPYRPSEFVEKVKEILSKPQGQDEDANLAHRNES
jgi:hypothetical protein